MNKVEAREQVWSMLRKVARPDSRFDFDFEQYIPDFEGSHAATDRLIATGAYAEAAVLFITPDNCLEDLRAQAIRDHKVQLVSTYGIRRGLLELRPEAVRPGSEQYAATLDGLEVLGSKLSLAQLQAHYPRVDLVVTGASAVSRTGVRFGKGHGYFDLEWAMLYELGMVEPSTPVIVLAHDCQVVDVDLTPSAFDSVCDWIVTPTRTIQVPDPHKPTVGIMWERLAPGMMEAIPPLRELQEMQRSGSLRRAHG